VIVTFEVAAWFQTRLYLETHSDDLVNAQIAAEAMASEEAKLPFGAT
jgi:hypothetical protein